jgi:hypothetical protein
MEGVTCAFACCNLIACAALSACAIGKPSAPSVAASESGVQLHPARPDPVQRRQRIWIDSSKSAFGYPSFASADDGIQAMKEQAGQAGATGLLNVMCMDGKGWNDGELLCYGDAIKFN